MRIPRLGELKPFFRFLGGYLVIYFVALFLALIINPEMAIRALAIVLGLYLLSIGLNREFRIWTRMLSGILGAYLLLGVFTRELSISVGVSYALLTLYPYQLSSGYNATATFMTIYMLVFGASVLAGMRLEGEELWEATAAIGTIGAVILILAGLFTDPSTFIAVGKSIPMLASIIGMVGFLGDIMALLIGEFMSILIIFAVSLIGAGVGEYVL